MSDRFLIVRLGAVGDVVHALPLASAIRAAYPNAHIAWAVAPGTSPLLEENPDINQVLIVDTIGSYTVTVANIFGCESTSQPFIVDSAAGLSPPEICIAGVNSVINFNQIIWEKPFSAAIDSFYVYQETSSAGVYQKIGANAYSDTSIFNDLSSDPSVQDYRY